MSRETARKLAKSYTRVITMYFPQSMPGAKKTVKHFEGKNLQKSRGADPSPKPKQYFTQLTQLHNCCIASLGSMPQIPALTASRKQTLPEQRHKEESSGRKRRCERNTWNPKCSCNEIRFSANDKVLAWPCLQSLAVKKSFIFCKFWAVKNF